MDNLTLQCLTNKKTYNKYLAKKDPSTFQKNEDFHHELRVNHNEIMNLLSDYILNPHTISQSRLRDMFNHLMIECLDVIECQKCNAGEQTAVEVEVPKYSDDLFSNCVDLGIEPKNTIEYWKMQSVFKS